MNRRIANSEWRLAHPVPKALGAELSDLSKTTATLPHLPLAISVARIEGRHAPVPLPTVGRPKWIRTAYHVASTTVVAHTTPGNIIDYNTIPFFKPLQAFFNNLSARCRQRIDYVTY
jgi:hypothetical protein